MNNKFNKRAFSLIELSIVILIIGILVAGVTTASRLVKQMKINSIKQMTYSSPVAGIKGLSLWLETSLEGSVTGAVNPFNPDENEKISSWNDINPQTSTRVILGQNNDALRPFYTSNSTINSLPALRFDGAQWLFSIKAFGGNIPLNPSDDSFTLIAVWQTNVNTGVNQAIIDQNSLSNIEPAGARAGILLTLFGTYGFCGQANDYWGCQPYAIKTPYISAITVKETGAVSVYTNSTTTGCNGNINANTLNISDEAFFIGVKSTNTNTERMNGLVQEVIIYDRALSNEELGDVMKYLSKKFAIRLN